MQQVPGPLFFKAVVLFSFLLCIELLFNTPGWSQSAPDDSEDKLLAPFAPPTLSHASVFDNYHGYQDQEVASWLEANETVGRIGGWRYYLEEASPSHQHPVTQPKDTHRHSGHGAKP